MVLVDDGTMGLDGTMGFDGTMGLDGNETDALLPCEVYPFLKFSFFDRIGH